MRPSGRDHVVQCLRNGLSEKIGYRENILTHDLVCATRSLENWFHFILENGCRPSLDYSPIGKIVRIGAELVLMNNSQYLHVDLQ
jgi:hypothetical protein